MDGNNTLSSKNPSLDSMLPYFVLNSKRAVAVVACIIGCSQWDQECLINYSSLPLTEIVGVCCRRAFIGGECMGLRRNLEAGGFLRATAAAAAACWQAPKLVALGLSRHQGAVFRVERWQVVTSGYELFNCKRTHGSSSAINATRETESNKEPRETVGRWFVALLGCPTSWLPFCASLYWSTNPNGIMSFRCLPASSV